ncbi:TetR/AcrR family transcriptional regulator [Ammoniphilus sp. YIM 78166]|uniref:TetR/AcrR family transcriptional regulator n=1 Tax=Ammoniphilus sp. YIM 78166 TaxID=1644106 RepID=UPI00106F40F8|nr:TetR/AcrR family transcriptional regulator [Ammoniphilus sp. YIM 78166]
MKKKQLLQAGLEEFAEKGYDLASTNAIIKKAGVSKGLLFHHFQNKKTLFLYIGERCMEYFFSYLESESSSISADPLERLRDLNLVKMKLFIQKPLIYHLAIYLLVVKSEEIQEEADRFEQRFNERYFRFYLNGMNTEILRNDISYEKILAIIFESVEALTRRYVEKYKQVDDKALALLEELYEDLTDYIDILKYGIYNR